MIDHLENQLLGHGPPPGPELEDLFETRRFALDGDPQTMDPASIVLLVHVADRWHDALCDDFGMLSDRQQSTLQTASALVSQPADGWPFSSVAGVVAHAIRLTASRIEIHDDDLRLGWLGVTFWMENLSDWECVVAAAELADELLEVEAGDVQREIEVRRFIDSLREAVPSMAEGAARLARRMYREPSAMQQVS